MISVTNSETKVLSITVNINNTVEVIKTDMNLDLRRNVDYLIREAEQKCPGLNARAKYIKEELDKNYPGITFMSIIFLEGQGGSFTHHAQGYWYAGKYKGYKYIIVGSKK